MTKKKKIAFCNSFKCAGYKCVSSIGIQKLVPFSKSSCPDCSHALIWLDEKNTPGYRRAGATKGKRPESERYVNG